MTSFMHGLWQGKTPLVLASKSASRQALLKAAGIPFETVASGIDEREVEEPLLQKGASAAAIAAHLAFAKAQAVAVKAPGRYVLGADQTLAFEGRVLAKPASRAEARAQLIAFAGKTHALHSALALVRDQTTVFETVVTAQLTCRAYDEAFVARYLESAGDAVLASVGAYQLEGLGIHLFAKIEGDQATILGLPLLPLLDCLRREGLLAG